LKARAFQLAPSNWPCASTPSTGRLSFLAGLNDITMPKSNPRFWTEEDDNLLRSMAAAGKSITMMTLKLGRPIRIIKSRAQHLHIVLPGEDKNTKRWVG
jgi:hypothetical protein